MYIIGASGHGKVVAEIVQACGMHINAFADANPAITTHCGRPVLRDVPPDAEAIIAIGNCTTRRRVAENTPCRYLTAIHPSAIVSPTATIGEGTVVMQGAVIQADAHIGRHCIVNTRASIDHECRIGDFVHIAPGCTVSGDVEIGSGTWLGVGSTVIQGVRIGRDCFIGAGSVVVSDIPDGVKAFGVPCRPVSSFP